MKKETVLTNSITAYKCLFILTMLVSAVPYLHEIISPYIKILLGVGLLLAAADIILGGRRWKSGYLWILLGFAGAYVITIVWNRNSHLAENGKAWLYMLVIFLLFYGYDIRKSREHMHREMKIVYHTFLGGVFVCSLVCLFTYLFSYNISYMVGESHMYIGMYDNRLWGLYNPNTGATLEMMSIFLSLAFLLEGRKKHMAYKIFFAVNLILQAVCLALANSRAPIAVAVLGVGVLVGVHFAGKFGCGAGLTEKKRFLKRLTGGAAIGILVMIMSAAGSSGIQTGMSYVPWMLKSTPIAAPVLLKDDYLSLPAKDRPSEIQKKTDLTRKEKEESRKGGTLTGRGDLWQAGFEGFLDSPAFGVGREGVYDACQGYLKDKTWQASLKNGGLHNIFLTVLVSSGAVGFLIFAVFLVLTLKDMFRYGFKKRGFRQNSLFLCNFVMLGAFAVTEMLEARILYRVGIFYVFFWMIYGYAMYEVQKEKETER